MTNPLATFSLDKRAFLHQKLDDILHSWARKSGHGTFFLSVTDGIPNFQFGLQLDLCDVATNPEPPLPPPQARQDHQHQEAHQRGKKARNRARAARFQAARAAASAATSTESRTSFPGQGEIVGTAPKPVLSLPLKKGDVFPPQSNPTSSTTSSAKTSSSVVRSPPPSASTISSTLPPDQPTNFRVPLKVKDAVLTDDSDDETEEFYDCGQCNSEIDSNAPSYYCPLCVKCFHVQCITGHKCISSV